MTITLNLSKAEEHWIEEQAKARGMAAADYALDLLQKDAEQTRQEKKRRTLEFIDSWDDVMDEEVAEQKESMGIFAQGSG